MIEIVVLEEVVVIEIVSCREGFVGAGGCGRRSAGRMGVCCRCRWRYRGRVLFVVTIRLSAAHNNDKIRNISAK